MSDLLAIPQVMPQPWAATASPVPSPRLVSAAHEFEAAMMKELLSPLEPGHDSLGVESDEGSSSALGSFAGEALGKAISEHGGLGIATSILHRLSREGNRSATPSVPQGRNESPTNSPSL